VVAGPTGTRKTLLLRGVGPTLSRFGVSSTLAQLQVALYDRTGGALESAYTVHTFIYDGPGAVSYLDYPFEVPGLMAQVGAFPLLPVDLTAVRPDRLTPGAYTFHVSGADENTGVALAELYEIDADPQPFVNLSARAWAGHGEDTFIAGFVLGGSQPATLLIRSLGPALAADGIHAPLADPALTLYDAAGSVIASNTGWSHAADPSALAQAAATVGASALPAGSADSALLLTAEPGLYTVHTAGASGGSGVALIEIYLLPPE
jgi:hypothetical protein